MKTLYFLILLGATALGQTTDRVSKNTHANFTSGASSISADGRYVAFNSTATNLVTVPTSQDVFVRDLVTGTTELVSVASDGSQGGNGYCARPSISADGRYVVFDSAASNLVAGDTNNTPDIFVRDRLNGTTERVSVDSGGVQSNGFSACASISVDGRYVAFESAASNLVAGDTNGKQDVFVRDRQTGTTERVSVATGGGQANDDSSSASSPIESSSSILSADGRYVAFSSVATNLVANDTNASGDIFVRDRLNGTTERVSVGTGGAEANAVSLHCSISADGGFVAFGSSASNLVAGDTNGVDDIFVRDRQSGTTERVSVATDGTQANGTSSYTNTYTNTFYGYFLAISADGRYVAFFSEATNLVAGTIVAAAIYVRDRQNGTTEQADIATGGAKANDASYYPTISADGRYVGFTSYATDLIPDYATDFNFDVYVHDRQLDTTALVSAAAGQSNSSSDECSISADGRCVAFRSNASNLSPHDTNGLYDVFVYDRSIGTVELASLSSSGVQGNDVSVQPSLSSTGRYVVFESDATNLVAGDTNGWRDIFLRDRQALTTQRVSIATDGTEGDSFSFNGSVSADGRYVAFGSAATNLVTGDTNGVWDIFVRDVTLSTTERASIATNGQQQDGASYIPTISADGRYVAFASVATNLVAGDTNGFYDVFVRDRVNATTERVSIATGGAQANSDSYGTPSLSANGRYVAFESNASNLVPADTNNSIDVFVHDRQTGTTERVSVASDGSQGNSDSNAPVISGDGRFVAFQSASSNLVAGDTDSALDVFVHDRLTGMTRRVSVATDGTQENGYSVAPSISSDGRYVAFWSVATNLVANDTNGSSDVFVRDQGAMSAFTSFCFGDGSGAACPCANNGNAGHGCQNSASTGGAVLTATGGASLSLDTVALTSSSELSTSTSVVLQGVSAVSPAIFGDGLRCAGGTLKRLYTKHAVGGVMTAPQTGDPSISARSAALGDTIPLGATRIYQVYYRDANLTFCPGGFNTTNAIAVAWGA
jgi:Tol biopolymer transport system component